MLTIIILIIILWLVGEEAINNHPFVWGLLIIFTLSLWVILTPWKPDYELQQRTNIYAMNDLFGSHGMMFSISFDGYFFFYEKNGAGYKIGKIDSNGYIIYEDEEVTPYFATYKRPHSSIWSALFGFPICPSKKEIHVPKNSIQKNINFDLSN